MNARHLTVLAVLTIASAAAAQVEVPPRPLPEGLEVRRLYVNPRTGERRVADFGERTGRLVWGYVPADIYGLGFYAPVWGAGGYGWTDTEIWNTGRIRTPSTIDGVQFCYYAGGTQSPDAEFTMHFAVADEYDLCAGRYPALASARFAVRVPADPSSVWIITVDLAGSEFQLSADGGPFGYMFFADMSGSPEVIGPTGPLVVQDDSATAPGARGVFEGLPVGAIGEGCYFFGGEPFAQFYIQLLGTAPCGADFNRDGFLDFFDYDDFVACFTGAGCPPGRDADVTLDGFTDFMDYLDFVWTFEVGC